MPDPFEPFAVDKIFVHEFASNFLYVAQQKKSVFEPAVQKVTGIKGESKSIDFMAKRKATRVIDRYGDTPLRPQQYSRRWLDLFEWEDGDLLTDTDKIRMLKDPQSGIVQNMVMGLNRAKDEEIVQALGGLSRAWDGSIPLPASQKIAHGGSGLSKAKLVEALKHFRLNHVGPEDGEELYMAISAYQLADLLNDTELTNTEVNTVASLVDGTLNSAKLMGFKVLQYQDLPTYQDGNDGIQTVYCWAKSGVALGIGSDIKSKVGENPGKRFNTEVYASMFIGAVRGEEIKVMSVDCRYM
jgi:hypothetical protein